MRNLPVATSQPSGNASDDNMNDEEFGETCRRLLDAASRTWLAIVFSTLRPPGPRRQLPARKKSPGSGPGLGRVAPRWMRRGVFAETVAKRLRGSRRGS